MAKYQVTLYKTISYVTDVEADNPEAAVEEAVQESPGMCHQCKGYGKKWEVNDDAEWETAEERPGYDPKFDEPSVQLIG